MSAIIRLQWFVCAMLLFPFLNLDAQSPWSFQSPDPQGNTLNSISYCDENHGFSVGSYGTIIHTNNAGLSWQKQKSGVLTEINDVQCIDPNTAYAVGEEGLILKTTNAGESWTIQASGTTEDLVSLSFANTHTGTVVGSSGTVLHTMDGGINWIDQDVGINVDFSGVDFSDVNTGTIVGEKGRILRTTNGGKTWNSQSSGVFTDLSAVSFYDEDFGMATGLDGLILITMDGGDSWIKNNSITTQDLLDVFVHDPQHITIVGKNQAVILMTDQSYTIYHQVGDNDFYGACHGNVVGSNGQIFRTDDWGNSWNSQKLGVNRDLKSVDFYDQNMGLAVGDNGTILRTTDGGESWELREYNSPSTNGSINDYLSDVCMNSIFNGYAVCGYRVYNSGVGFFSNGSILKTSNGGGSWSVLYHSDDNNYYGVAFADNNTGIAVGLYKKWEDNEYQFRSAFSRTTDGGNTWDHRHFTSIEDKLNAVSYINNQIVMVGASGRILRSVNNGDNFSTVNAGVSYDLNGVSFIDQDHGFIVGDHGTILKTFNGGSLFAKLNAGTTKNLLSVSFSDPDNGMICAEDGTVFRTTDGGLNWFQQKMPADTGLSGVSLIENNAFVVGEMGTIFNNPNSDRIYAYEQVSICEGDTYEGWEETGQYTRLLTSTTGQDSTIETFLTVHPLPDMPVIHQSNDTLYSSSPYGNQWYLNGNPIPWGTNQFLPISGLGDYYVVVTNTAGCSSAESETISITTDVQDLSIQGIFCYPNPITNSLTIELPTLDKVEIHLFDMLGKQIMSRNFQNIQLAEIGMEFIPPGIYLIQVDSKAYTYSGLVEKR